MIVKDLLAMCDIEKYDSLTQFERLVASPHPAHKGDEVK